MNRIKVKSIAKINFGLRVLSKRDDSYHNLQTLFLPMKRLFDEIIFEKAKLFTYNSNNTLLNGNSNLIIKALQLLENKLIRKFNVKINLTKRIPIGAGLGGGSSNAASTLLALNKLFDLELSSAELMKYALQLGSDVPFFINPTPSIGTSRGEILTPFYLCFNKHILLVNPGIHISTKEAFASININNNNGTDYNNILDNNSIVYAKANIDIVNDFEEYVFNKFPEIAAIKKLLINNGALFAQMSGTGSTVYGIFESLELAKATVQLFPKHYFLHLERV